MGNEELLWKKESMNMNKVHEIQEQRREAELQLIMERLKAGEGTLENLAGPHMNLNELRAKLAERGVRIEQIEEGGGERLILENQEEGTVRVMRPMEGIHIEYADLQYEQEAEEEEEFVALQMEGNLAATQEDYKPQVNRAMETWREVRTFIEKATEDMAKYRDFLEEKFFLGDLAAEQIRSRVQAIKNVYRELKGNPDDLEAFAGETAAQMQEKWKAYTRTWKSLSTLDGRMPDVEEIAEETSIRKHCEQLGTERGDLFLERQSGKEVRLRNRAEWKWGQYETAWTVARAENGDFGEKVELQEQKKPRPMYPGEVKPEQEERLREADRWLLETAMKKDKKMEDSIVFNLLNRSDVERIFAYYLIEKGCPSKITEGEILLFRRKEYRPNLGKLKKAKPGLSDLERVYHLAYEAGMAIDRLDEVQVASGYIQTALYGWEEQQKQQGAQNADKEEKSAAEQEEERRARELQGMIDSIEDSFEALETAQKKYETANLFQKKKRKAELSKAAEKLYQSANNFLAAEIHVPGNDSISKVMDVIKDGMMMGTVAKTIGVGGAVTFKGLAAAGETWARAAAGMTTIAAHSLGVVLGSVNLLFAVAGILKSYKSFSNLTGLEQAGLAMDWVSQLLSPTSAMASSSAGMTAVLVTDVAAQATAHTAVVATAGVGAVVGGISTLAGTYRLGTAIAEGKKAKKAYERLQEQKGPQKYEEQANRYEGDDEIFYLPKEANTQQSWNENFNFEKNIFKIQERINKRTKISAGCQAASGVCAMAASVLLATQQQALAAALGIVGVGIAAGGLIATQIIKSREYEKAVDEYLNLDAMAEKRYAEIQERRVLKESEKKKIRKNLRKDMMQQWGFTSVKSFYVYIMSEYAKFIYRKISPLFSEALNPVGMEADTEIYKQLVESLGLKIQKATKPESKGGKKSVNRPTVEMICKKLMG